MFDETLVHAIAGGKDLDCGWAELSVNLVLTRGHGSCSLTYDTSGPWAIRNGRRSSIPARQRGGWRPRGDAITMVAKMAGIRLALHRDGVVGDPSGTPAGVHELFVAIESGGRKRRYRRLPSGTPYRCFSVQVGVCWRAAGVALASRPPRSSRSPRSDISTRSGRTPGSSLPPALPGPYLSVGMTKRCGDLVRRVGARERAPLH